ncbi:MAG: DUF3619 family protein [Candidatus Accumulibacter sp.]|jgi:hypothetical protein|nr:DUF3619 family protein [Accumulibacter sp.]
MNEAQFVRRLRQQLNRGLRELPPGTLARLSAARQAALARHERAAARPTRAAGPLSAFRDARRFGQTLAAAAFLLCVLYSPFWIADQRAEELGRVDAAILADELPLDAFTDQGFAAWLDSESPAQR